MVSYEWRGQHPTKDTWLELDWIINNFGPDYWHFFYDEPWAPWVVRFMYLIEPIEGVKGKTPHCEELPQLDNTGKWVITDEVNKCYDREEGYDALSDAVFALFQAASQVAAEIGLTTEIKHLRGSLTIPTKLIHCILNMWGYNNAEEAEFHANEATIFHTLSVIETDEEFEKHKDLLVKIRGVQRKRGHLEW